jgi:tetratricopeptide (TPR) repeat protein
LDPAFLTVDGIFRIFKLDKGRLIIMNHNRKQYQSKIKALPGGATTVGKLVCIALFASIGISSLPADDLREGKILLDRATEGLFNQSLSSTRLRELLDRSLQSFGTLQEPCDRDYWRAQVSYLYGFVEQGEESSREAERRFTEGYELAESALRCGEFSDGYRLLADTQAQLLMFNGILYKMNFGPKVRELAEKALELNPENIKALLTLALFYKNAPAIAGGSEKKALELLHGIEKSSGLEPLDRFSVNMWLGISYAENNDGLLARKYISQAQEIFPGNTWLQELLTEHSL